MMKVKSLATEETLLKS
ncbi:hypothetical protein Zm00014a_005450 [Zea mays]|uniref:Uncharacterized protein n=1 Tax=Zea mays TaxID=4577 RepID=A0A317Y311_MAIZE|nr:hypothetical protein Zm00014a_005450 [Zea mays]